LTAEPQRTGGGEPATPWPLIALAGGLAAAAISILLAAVGGPPYLSLSSLSPWIVLFAAAAFVALFAVPFAANRLTVAADPSRAEGWERAMLLWGAVALLTLGLGVALIALGGFSPARSLEDAVGLLLAIEAGMVVLVLLAWVLAG
jgi:hypothetical protein